MSRQQIVSFTWTCDVCGSGIPESDAEGASRKISWEGTDYLVDLCAVHQAQLGEALANLKIFVDAGQRTTAGRGRRKAASAAPSTGRGLRPSRDASKSGSRARRRDIGAIRSWARDNGHQVSERGRIASSVMSAYDDANSSDPPAAAPTPRKRGSRKATVTS